MEYRVQKRESNGTRAFKAAYGGGGIAFDWSTWKTILKTPDLEKASEIATKKRKTFTQTRVLDTSNTVVYY